jgi:hypothetical protein
MHKLTADNLGHACRLFMDRAYPAGPGAIPAKKRPYYDIPASAALADYLPPAPVAAGVCEVQAARNGNEPGYAFRLGSSHFPHIKLRVQQVEHHGSPVWVWSVDTHDALPRAALAMSPDETALWRELQAKNASLKQQIEEALEQARFLTGNSLLRLDLPTS